MKKYTDIDWNKFSTLGKALVGKPYVFGAETNLNDPDPAHITALDCSELIEWLYHQVGIPMPDGSYNQDTLCKSYTGELLVGDLGFKWHPDTHVIHHVGTYIGENMVLEAKGKAWGVILTSISAFMHVPDWAHWSRYPDFISA